MKYFFINICIFFTYVYSSPRVETEDGKLKGTNYTLPNGRMVNAFLGVPFAAPPIGRLRFEEARPVKRWTGYRNADTLSKFCVQFFHTPEWAEMLGEEDCLYLNIYTPRLPKNDEEDENLMNVLFYVYGGGFSAGSGGRIIPDYVLQNEDIVFVSINYRVGPIGFFSTGDEVTPGNNGFKDALEALRWVQKNIRHFGGDPDKVTLYGSSTGAATVHYLLLSPLSRGLFHNAVSSGGSSLSAWALPQTKRVENSMALASSVNCPTFNTRLMMMCLKRKPIKQLYEASAKFFKGKIVTQIPFGPVIEPKIEGAVISEHPYDSLKNGPVYDVPLMVGFVEQEASPAVIRILYNKTKMKELNDKWTDVAPRILLYDHVNSKSQRNHISSSVRQRYFGDRVISNQNTKALFQAFGDRLFYNGVIKSTKLHRSAISEKIYCYKLYYRGTGSHCDHHSNPIKKNYGTCHGDDQFYLISFGNRTQYNDNAKSKVDLDMVNLSTSIVVAFMKTGNPNTPDLDWKPISRNGSMNCLNIYSYTHQRMLDIEESDAIKFWEEALHSEY